MKKSKFLVLSIACIMMLTVFTCCIITGCSDTGFETNPPDSTVNADTSASITEENYNGKLIFDHSMELTSAKLFTVDYFKGGYKLITVTSTESAVQKILTVPEGMSIPAEVEDGTIVLQMPLTDILVSSTPTTSLINAIGVLDRISLTTTEYDAWYIDEVKTAMDAEKIIYIGSYKEPDYEMLVAAAPPFAVFSTMLSSVPEVAEKLDELRIPVLLDQATYEEQPLARVEWAKLYGALFDCEDTANTLFEEQVKYVEEIPSATAEKTVAMFYITSKNVLYARQGGDYMAKMLEMADGKYIFADINPEETGTIKMDFESFYAGAKDADYIIYIWSLGGKPETLADFTSKNELFADFKAVKEGNVWCTTPDFFQISDTLGYMIKDIHTMLTMTDDSETITYLFKLK